MRDGTDLLNLIEMRIINKPLLLTAFCVLLLYCFSSCKDEHEEVNATTSIASIYPTVVMEGTTLQVTGSGLDKTLRVVFPGDKVADDVETKLDQMLLVKVPANIGPEESPLILVTPSGEIVSRQTLRKASPRINYFIPSEEVTTYNELSIVGYDFLLSEAICIDNGKDKMVIEAIDFIRKSNSEIKIHLPKETPLGDAVNIYALFPNQFEVNLGVMSISQGEGGGHWVESEQVIYSGESKNIGSWDNLIIAKESFAKAKVEDVIRVYIDEIGDSPQGALKVPSGNWSGLTEELGCFDITSSDIAAGYYDSTISNEEMLNKLLSHGLAISGQNYTVTKVTLFTSVWVDDNADGDSTDPITEHTIILNDFEPTGDHNSGWDHSWTDSEATEFVVDEKGNTYMYIAKDLPGDSWVINCNHVDRGDVIDIENYVIKLDIKIDENTTGFSSATMQFVIADNWCWVGENFFPETTGGKWVTIRFDAANWLSGNLSIGKITCGLFGKGIPAGISIDNFRLDPQ